MYILSVPFLYPNTLSLTFAGFSFTYIHSPPAERQRASFEMITKLDRWAKIMHSAYAVCIYRVDASIAPHVSRNAFIRFNKGWCSDCRLGWLWLSGSVPPKNATNCSFSIDGFRCKLWKWESEHKELWMLVVLWMSIIHIRLTTGFTCAYWAHLFIKNQHSIMNHPALCAI